MYVIFGRNNCPYCDKAKELCERIGVDYQYVDVLADRFDSERMHRAVFHATGAIAKTVPQIFQVTTISGGQTYIGGYTELASRHQTDLDIDFDEDL